MHIYIYIYICIYIYAHTQTGGVKLIVTAINLHPTHTHTHKHTLIHTQSHRYTQAGGVKLVVITINLHPTNTHTHRHTHTHTQADGVKLVVTAINLHPTDPTMQMSGCGLIFTLHTCNASIDLVLLREEQALDAHRKQTSVKTTSDNRGRLTQIQNIIRKHKEILLRDDAYEAVICALTTHKEDSIFQYSTIDLYDIMVSLSKNNSEQVTSLRRKCVPVVLHAMGVNLQDEELQTTCCATLALFVTEKFLSEEMYRYGGIRVLSRCMDAHQTQTAIVRDVCTILYASVKGHVRNQDKCREEGSIEVLAKVVNRYTLTNKELETLALQVCSYTFICVCVCVCIYVCIHMHMHMCEQVLRGGVD
jgi:hypothetical protein